MFDTFNAEKNTAQIQLNLLRNDEIVFLFKQNFGINKINCFDHLLTIGGNLYNPIEYFGAIQGIDEYITLVITADMNQLLEISSAAAPVPTMEDFMCLNLMDNYRSLKPSLTEYYTARNFIPVPPFMPNALNQLMVDYNGNSKRILITAIQIIKEFNKEIKESGNNEIERATSTCFDILCWIYLATKGKINSIPTQKTQ